MHNLKDLDFTEEESHVRHSFILAFYFLLRSPKCSYETAIRQTIQLRGDTDTNACIVGGMLGALFGSEGILTAELRNKVLGFDCSAEDPISKRPDYLSLKQNFSHLVEKIISLRPIIEVAKRSSGIFNVFKDIISRPKDRRYETIMPQRSGK